MFDRTEERITDPDTGGEKARKLARFDLLPWRALWKVAEHYGVGARKYDDHNWRRGYPWSLSFGAQQRHAALFWEGEDYDPETGTHHQAAVAFHALTLLTFAEEHPDKDDRFVTVSARELIEDGADRAGYVRTAAGWIPVGSPVAGGELAS